MTTEDKELDLQWRRQFGQPMPILGCPDIVRTILATVAPIDPGDGPAADAARHG